MKVVIIGLGALGSHLVQGIRNLPVSLVGIDFDSVEIKNTLSQFHVLQSKRKNKAQALSGAMKMFYGKSLEAIPHRLDEKNVEVLLSDADLVVDCVDNGATRKIIQEFVRKHDIPCLHGGLAPDGKTGLVEWDETFVVDMENDVGGETCENGEFLPFIMLVSARLALAVQDFVETKTKRNALIGPYQITLM